MKPRVEIGQVYRDKDKRMGNRHLCVVYLFSVGDNVELIQCHPNGVRFQGVTTRTRISRKNLQTRFEMIGAKE